jgi:hypothetical protein
MSGAQLNQALEMQLALQQSDPLKSNESARQAFLMAVAAEQNQTQHLKSVQKSNRQQSNSGHNATQWTHQ